MHRLKTRSRPKTNFQKNRDSNILKLEKKIHETCKHKENP